MGLCRFRVQVFQGISAIPAWIKAKSPGTEELWAPDVQRVGGEFRMYYAYSLFGAGPGGETAVPVAGGEDLLVYHAYDPVSGKPSLQLSTMEWKDGWPVVGLAAE